MVQLPWLSSTHGIDTLLGCHFRSVSSKVLCSDPHHTRPFRTRTRSKEVRKGGEDLFCGSGEGHTLGKPCWLGVIIQQFLWEDNFSLLSLMKWRDSSALFSSFLHLWLVRTGVCHETPSRMTTPLASCLPIWLPETVCNESQGFEARLFVWVLS